MVSGCGRRKNVGGEEGGGDAGQIGFVQVLLGKAGVEIREGLCTCCGAVVAFNEPSGEFLLGIHGMSVGLGGAEQEKVIFGHEFIGDAHELAEHCDGGFRDADVVVEALGHLVDAIESFEEGHEHDDLFGLAFLSLQISADENVEQLVGASEFDIGLNHDGVPSLDDGVLDFVEAHGIAAIDAVSEILAMEHLLEGHATVEADDIDEGHFGKPVAVEDDLGFFTVENFEGLFTERFGVAEHLFAAELRAGFGAP